MKRDSITEVKNGLSALLDRVKGGTAVLIVDRGRPVARLEPVEGLVGGEGGRLAQRVRDGIVRPARGHVPRALIGTPPPKAKAGMSALRALIDERRDGR